MITNFLSFRDSSLLDYDFPSNWSISIFTKNSLLLQPQQKFVLPLGFSLNFGKNEFFVQFSLHYKLAENSIISLGHSFEYKKIDNEINVILFNLVRPGQSDAFSNLFGNKGVYKIKGNECIGNLSVIKFENLK